MRADAGGDAGIAAVGLEKMMLDARCRAPDARFARNDKRNRILLSIEYPVSRSDRSDPGEVDERPG
jgi:hypothetical protein